METLHPDFWWGIALGLFAGGLFVSAVTLAILVFTGNKPEDFEGI